MAAKLATFFITFILCIAIGVVVLATMLNTLNGYSESDSTWGLGSFVVLAFAVSLSMSLSAFFLAGTLQKKQNSRIAASIISIPVLSIVGLGLEIVSSLIGIGVAEFVRVNY